MGADLLCSAAMSTCTSLQALREPFPPEPAPVTTAGGKEKAGGTSAQCSISCPSPFERFQSWPSLSTLKCLLSGQRKGSSTEVFACVFSGRQHRRCDTRTVTTSTCNNLQRRSTEQGHPSRDSEPSKGCRTRVATQEHPRGSRPPCSGSARSASTQGHPHFWRVPLPSAVPRGTGSSSPRSRDVPPESPLPASPREGLPAKSQPRRSFA